MNPLEPDAPDAEVIARSLRTPESFAVVFDRHHAAVHAYATRRAGQQAADDVLADVFLAAFAGRGTFDAAVSSARPWLFGIAANVLRRRWRTVASRERLLHSAAVEAERAAAAHGADAVRRAEAADEWAAVRPLLAGLAEPDREALLLYAWEELSYPEIAEAMGIPLGTVRSRIHRARSTLRASLEAQTMKESQ